MNQKKEAIYDARELGVPKMLLLGLQHMFAMFGATILVPILVNTYFNGEGLSIQVTLICAGIGTLFFHLCTKLKVPAFLGSSFAFLGGFHTVANLDTGIFKDMSMGEKLPYACGGIVVAGKNKLASCNYRICSYRNFQYLGQRNVQDHSNPYGCCDLICSCIYSFQMWCSQSGRICNLHI